MPKKDSIAERLCDVNDDGRLVFFEPSLEEGKRILQGVAQGRAAAKINAEVQAGNDFSKTKRKGGGQAEVVALDASRILRCFSGLLPLGPAHEPIDKFPEEWLTNAPDAPAKEEDIALLRTLQRASSSFGEKSDKFAEYLGFAEFAMQKINKSVELLRDPARFDRPFVYNEYTETMVKKVCNDLGQWLSTMPSLISMYHMHILDLDSSQKKAVEQSSDLQKQLAACNDERRALKHDVVCLQELRKEDQMKAKADRMLGRSAPPLEDGPIYSEKDMEQLRASWEKEHVKPLLEEISEGKIELDKLQADLKKANQRLADARRDGKPKGPVPVVDDTGLSKDKISVIVNGINAAAERVGGNHQLSSVMTQFSQDIAAGGDGLNAIVMDINRLPMPTAEVSIKVPDGSGAAQLTARAASCLDVVNKELEQLESDLKPCAPASVTCRTLAWAKQSLGTLHAACRQVADGHDQGSATASITWEAAPRPDGGALATAFQNAGNSGDSGKDELMQLKTKVVRLEDTIAKLREQLTDSGANVVDEEALAAKLRSQIREQLSKELEHTITLRLRDEIEAEVKARLKKEKPKKEKEEDSSEMTDELAKAYKAVKERDALVEDLRRRLRLLQREMKMRGLGGDLDDAFAKTGLAAFVKKGSVYERLYSDALERIQRFAEAEARHHEAISEDFLAAVRALLDPSMPLIRVEKLGTPKRSRSPTPFVSQVTQYASEGVSDRSPQLPVDRTPRPESQSKQHKVHPETEKAKMAPVKAPAAQQRRVRLPRKPEYVGGFREDFNETREYLQIAGPHKVQGILNPDKKFHTTSTTWASTASGDRSAISTAESRAHLTTADARPLSVGIPLRSSASTPSLGIGSKPQTRSTAHVSRIIRPPSKIPPSANLPPLYMEGHGQVRQPVMVPMARSISPSSDDGSHSPMDERGRLPSASSHGSHPTTIRLADLMEKPDSSPMRQDRGESDGDMSLGPWSTSASVAADYRSQHQTLTNAEAAAERRRRQHPEPAHRQRSPHFAPQDDEELFMQGNKAPGLRKPRTLIGAG